MIIRNIIKQLLPESIKESLCIFHRFLQRKKNEIKYAKLFQETEVHYRKLAEKLHDAKRIRFGAYVVYDSTFGAYELMDLMLRSNSKYDPKIVIIPDTARGLKHLKEQYICTRDFFINKYGAECIVDGYDADKECFLDVSKNFDVIYCANPYDIMVNEVHQIQYLIKQDVLLISISYCFLPDKYSSKFVIPSLEMSLFWKVFAETRYTYEEYKKYQLVHARNVYLSGYAKMDSYFKASLQVVTKPIKSKYKKQIIIAPHHTVKNDILPLSNFLSYYDFIVELATIFLDVHFVFRPHPLLFVTLVNMKIWTENDVSIYLKRLHCAGIEYSTGGDYFTLFASSDAIIHDCSSFITEWLFTGKPGCFVVRSSKTFRYLSKLGRKSIKYYNIAYNKNDIIIFIEKILSASSFIDYSEDRELLDNIKINYPNVSEKILQEISFF
ncbi:hypothetical protein [Treponema pedis]|uniref:hypothetical protein n=1 Tax=Treponema pedis TaxID=409322 RepID=UPI003D25DC35